MRNLTVGAIVCLLMGGMAAAQAPDAQVMAPIQKFVDSFNKGDVAGAAAAHAADANLSIIDEVAPFHWRGPRAFQEWSTALDADSKKRGITEPMVKIGAPTRTEVSGDVGIRRGTGGLYLQGSGRGKARIGANDVHAEEERRRLADSGLDVDGPETVRGGRLPRSRGYGRSARQASRGCWRSGRRR